MNWLRIHLTDLQLPQPAIDWLVMLYDSTQTLDDYADGNTVSREVLDKLIWNVLFAMPANAFFAANSQTLLPLVANSILKWQASDLAERAKAPSEMSFVWRAGFFDIVLVAVAIVRGNEYAVTNSAKIMSMYGEKYAAYLGEFQNA